LEEDVAAIFVTGDLAADFAGVNGAGWFFGAGVTGALATDFAGVNCVGWFFEAGVLATGNGADVRRAAGVLVAGVFATANGVDVREDSEFLVAGVLETETRAGVWKTSGFFVAEIGGGFAAGEAPTEALVRGVDAGVCFGAGVSLFDDVLEETTS